jgi:hypothetical protein
VREVTLRYPHDPCTYLPRRMRAVTVWRVAEQARAQLYPHSQRLKLELAQVISRARRMRINGIAFETHWECGQPLTDEAGQVVLGATEHDAHFPDAAMIYLNAEVLEGAEDVARSTALHELGHAVFDTPSWVVAARTKDEAHAGLKLRLAPETSISGPESRFEIDWREWRANEFMGAFLAPKRLMQSAMLKRAYALGLSLQAGAAAGDLPIVRASRSEPDGLSTLVLELAELFGVSPGFVEVRLSRYGLVE